MSQHQLRYLRRPACRLALALLMAPGLGWSQATSFPVAVSAPASGASAPAPSAPAASSPAPAAPAAAASEPAAPRPAPASTAAPAVTPVPAATDCGSAYSLAMAADIRAATAQAKRAAATELAALLEHSVALWNDAANACEGRRREHARANRRDQLAALESVDELLEAGPQCASSQRDAGSLQELAGQAIGERRWHDASRLYRRASQLWELATEQCQGNQKVVAGHRLAEIRIDAHNAEHCAPLFDAARVQTQRARRTASSTTVEQGQVESQRAETLWRDAIAQCQGPALDMARTQAQQLARERGTAWVRTAMPVEVAAAPAAPIESRTLVPLARAGTAPAAAATGSASAPPAGPTAVATAVQAVAQASKTAQAAVTRLLAPTAEATAQGAAAAADTAGAVDVVLAGGTRLTGRLVRDPSDGTYTGQGKLAWRNGDVYEGDLLKGRRHGQGRFRWANGQHYEGTWADDAPSGRGRIEFVGGSRYEGAVAAGQPEGEGLMTHANGDQHQGRFHAGQPDGPGRLRWQGGTQLEARWQAGATVCPCTLNFPDGRVYVGDMRETQPHGRGTMRFPAGDSYEGEFGQGVPEGQGTYRWRNGDYYTGQWQAGRRHGQGRFVWSTGDVWEGRFADNAQTSDGTLTRASASAPAAAASAASAAR